MSSFISCIATNVQRRFLASNDHLWLKLYRCNLTALSQIYNLYFIAVNDSVHVFQPSFPDQRLTNEPALVIYPPVSSPNLRPYLDDQDPHSINRLHLDMLGQEEVILLACDDGDVVAYSTSAIQLAISHAVSAQTHNHANVRPLLHRNVGMSAWGLAIHREARLIAISANTAQVTVIAFALTRYSNKDSTPDDESLSGSIQSRYGDDSSPLDRGMDRVIILQAHGNIPSVSFDNTGADASGRWLFSSSINGVTHVWDLFNPTEYAQAIHLGRCISTVNPEKDPSLLHRCGCGQVAHAAWGTLVFNPRSCHPNLSHVEAFGVTPTAMEPYFWDTTDSRIQRRYLTSFPGTGFSFDEYYIGDGTSEVDESDSGSDDLAEITQAGQQWMDESDSADEQETTGEHNDQPTSGFQVNPPDPSVTTVHIDTPGPDLEEPSHQDGSVDESEEGSQSDDGSYQSEASSSPLFQPIGGTAIPAGLADILDRIRTRKRTYCEIVTPREPNRLPSTPCIIITKEEIYLIQSLSSPANQDDPDPGPIITIRNPLFPDEALYKLQPSWTKRLNLFAQIPELGVFVIGSNAGRCAIFSLTQTTSTGRSDGKQRQVVYGFRQECILPMEEQEGHESPGRHLLGLAVGPVQGMEDRFMETDMGRADKAERRWRLMLLFEDRTIMSYELSRKHKLRDPNMGEMMV